MFYFIFFLFHAVHRALQKVFFYCILTNTQTNGWVTVEIRSGRDLDIYLHDLFKPNERFHSLSAKQIV